MLTQVPDAVHTLDRTLREIFGGRLQSFVVYGLHAHAPQRVEHNRHEPGGHDTTAARARLTHTLAIVSTLATEDLRACATRVGKWHDAGLATPLFITGDEFARSLDAFPFEFGAILWDHLVVSGSNPFEGLSVHPADLRRACEVQARGHLLHLREGYIETRGRSDALAVLVVASAPAFAALLTSVARINHTKSAGSTDTHDAATAARHFERTLGLTANAASDIVQLAGVAEISSAQAEQLFPPYLDAVEGLVKYIDTWKQRDT
jgi:hypothetical protein